MASRRRLSKADLQAVETPILPVVNKQIKEDLDTPLSARPSTPMWYCMEDSYLIGLNPHCTNRTITESNSYPFA